MFLLCKLTQIYFRYEGMYTKYWCWAGVGRCIGTARQTFRAEKEIHTLLATRSFLFDPHPDHLAGVGVMAVVPSVDEQGFTALLHKVSTVFDQSAI